MTMSLKKRSSRNWPLGLSIPCSYLFCPACSRQNLARPVCFWGVAVVPSHRQYAELAPTTTISADAGASGAERRSRCVGGKKKTERAVVPGFRTGNFSRPPRTASSNPPRATRRDLNRTNSHPGWRAPGLDRGRTVRTKFVQSSQERPPPYRLPITIPFRTQRSPHVAAAHMAAPPRLDFELPPMSSRPQTGVPDPVGFNSDYAVARILLFLGILRRRVNMAQVRANQPPQFLNSGTRRTGRAIEKATTNDLLIGAERAPKRVRCQ